MEEVKYFFDSYAIIEIIKENKNYLSYIDEEATITIFNLAEIYYSILGDYPAAKADVVFDNYKDAVVEINDDVEVFDKPRTLVRGTLRASKSPKQTSAFKPRYTQGLFDILKEAMKFRKQNKKKDLSYTDCIGYIYALRKDMRFLTDDKEFEEMKGVEFVK